LRHVAILGGGILGLCTAWALRRAGHAVTLVDAAPALPAAGASSNDEGRIIRHAYGTMEGYAALMPRAFAAWRALFAETGLEGLVPCRAVYLLRDEGPWAAAVARTQAAAGLFLRDVPAAELDAWPMVSRAGLRRAVEVEGSGMLRAAPICAALADWLRPRAALRLGVPAREVAPRRIVLADGTRIEADLVIAASGAALPLLLPEAVREAGLRLSLQSLAYLEPPGDWSAAPLLLGRLPGHPAGGVYVLPPRGGTRLKIGDYDTSEPGAALRDDPRHVAAHRRAALLDAASRVIADFAAYRVTEQRHCLYVMAPGDRFVLREVEPGLVLASACSGHGFKLAALMGAGLAAFAGERMGAADLARWAAGEALPEAVPVPA
jgi:glycine/D-amino acid oxidase-like deaminating enzyme